MNPNPAEINGDDDGEARLPLKFPVRVTWVGVGTGILIVLIGLAAVNTGTNLLYLMLATLVSFWTITLALFRVNTSGIGVRRRFPAEIHAGQEVALEYEITSAKRRLTSYGLVVEEFPVRPELPRAAAYLAATPPLGSGTAIAKVVFPRRGWVRLRWIRVVSSFPFGFLVHRRHIDQPAAVLIWPALVPVREFIERNAASLGSLDSVRKGQGSSLYAIRGYVQGDPARSIHWKLTAKSGGLKVREFEREDARRYRLVLNPKVPVRPDDDDVEAFEASVSLAASLAREFIDGGHEVALWTPEGSTDGGTGAAQLRVMMRVLALTRIQAYAGGGGGSPPPPDDFYNDVWIAAPTGPVG